MAGRVAELAVPVGGVARSPENRSSPEAGRTPLQAAGDSRSRRNAVSARQPQAAATNQPPRMSLG